MPDIQWHMEGDEISLRDLRNHVSEVLRQVEGGTPLTVTVDRRPVARLVPLTTHGLRACWRILAQLGLSAALTQGCARSCGRC